MVLKLKPVVQEGASLGGRWGLGRRFQAEEQHIQEKTLRQANGWRFKELKMGLEPSGLGLNSSSAASQACDPWAYHFPFGP